MKGRLLISLLLISVVVTADSSHVVRKWNPVGIDVSFGFNPVLWKNLDLKTTYLMHKRILSNSQESIPFEADSFVESHITNTGFIISASYVLGNYDQSRFFTSRELRLGACFSGLSASAQDGGTVYDKRNDSIIAYQYWDVQYRSVFLNAHYLLNHLFAQDYAIYTGGQFGVTVFNKEEFAYTFIETTGPFKMATHYSGLKSPLNTRFAFMLGVPVGIKYNVDCSLNFFAEYNLLMRYTMLESRNDIIRLSNSFMGGVRFKFRKFDPSDETVEDKRGSFW